MPTEEYRASWLVCLDHTHRSQWRVRVRKANYSTFNGGRYTPSAYSAVVCLTCHHSWRTKAAYVDTLPNLSAVEHAQGGRTASGH